MTDVSKKTARTNDATAGAGAADDDDDDDDTAAGVERIRRSLRASFVANEIESSQMTNIYEAVAKYQRQMQSQRCKMA